MNYNKIVTEKQLGERVEQLATKISEDYAGKELTVICFVNGGSFLYADLVRKLNVNTQIHFLGFSAYNNQTKSGEVRVTLDVSESLEGKDVLLIEGIVVSGRTPKFIYDTLKLRNPASIEFCAIGLKPKSISVDIPIKYYGFEFEPEQMVAGYGIGKGNEKVLPYLILQ